ncbi:MAG: class I SAM-dependent methyltransferase [Burkholderiales bacterium]|nr:class I SAM-dependent methyltransferase [Burkholderiales bacterium]
MNTEVAKAPVPRKTHAQALERWNGRYAAPGFLFGEAPNAYLASKADLLPRRGRALSVADGEGRNSVWLAEHGLAVDALDFSPVALAKARALAAARGVAVDFARANVVELEWPAALYDVIAAIFIQFATPTERSRLFGWFKQALKPGGLLVLQGYRVEQLAYGTGGPPERDHLYTVDMVREAFADCEIVELAGYDAEIHEGSGHKGMSALLGAVVRRPPGA